MKKMYTEQRISGVVIAAVKSGSGKTTVTCALLEALKGRGIHPCAFKCGPDYIDPLFHKKVIGVPAHNLDSFFSEENQLREIFTENMNGRGIAVVEGVMGLFDGIGGVGEIGSAYHVASILKLPIVLVVDAHGMGRSLLPLLSGFLQYDKEKRIEGILLNRISEGFYHGIKPMIEKELGVSVLGFLPHTPEIMLESRHLGLKLPEEIDNLQEQLHKMADILEKTVSIDEIIEIAARGTGVQQRCFFGIEKPENSVKIGIAWDEAFCFYYDENLKLLEQNGAYLVKFSPLHDKKIPADLDAVIFGGGYPELYAERLEKNVSMRQSVRDALMGGMPSLAECGGFLYLHDKLEDDKKNTYYMCGVLSGKCFYTGKLVRFGYVELEEKNNNFMRCGGRIKGHEFHYYDSSENGNDCVAKKPVTERSWDCIFDRENHFWGFPHLYYPSNPHFVVEFIEKAKAFRRERKNQEG